MPWPKVVSCLLRLEFAQRHIPSMQVKSSSAEPASITWISLTQSTQRFQVSAGMLMQSEAQQLYGSAQLVWLACLLQTPAILGERESAGHCRSGARQHHKSAEVQPKSVSHVCLQPWSRQWLNVRGRLPQTQRMLKLQKLLKLLRRLLPVHLKFLRGLPLLRAMQRLRTQRHQND